LNHANWFKRDPLQLQLSTESSDSISFRNNGRKQLSRIFKLGQWKFYSPRPATSGKPRNVGVYCAHCEIKFLIELLRCIRTYCIRYVDYFRIYFRTRVVTNIRQLFGILSIRQRFYYSAEFRILVHYSAEYWIGF